MNEIRDGERFRVFALGRVTVEWWAHPEHTHPADTIDLDPESDAAYVAAIMRGDLPWYCLGVHVFITVYNPGRVARFLHVGSSYLGCVDTLNPREVGGYDIVREALADARATLDNLQGGEDR